MPCRFRENTADGSGLLVDSLAFCHFPGDHLTMIRDAEIAQRVAQQLSVEIGKLSD